MDDTNKPDAKPTKTAFELTVVHPFGDYERGQRITDADEIAKVLDSENVKSVNRVAAQQ
jgi:hypothetical protein